VPKWDEAVAEIATPHMQPLAEPWLPWNSLFLAKKCSAIGLRGSVLTSVPNHQNPPNAGVYLDFDVLQSVVVGRADGFRLPPIWSDFLMDDEDKVFNFAGVIEHSSMMGRDFNETSVLVANNYGGWSIQRRLSPS
jgi:hypothetical protein